MRYLRSTPSPASRALAIAVALGLFACQSAAPPASGPVAGLVVEPSQLDARVRLLRDEILPDAEVSAWVGGAEGVPWFALAADAARPSASAIKTAYMVELFSRFSELDRPLPLPVEALADGHPAIAHFDPATRDEIRRELDGVSVRRLAHAMIRGTDVSNAVYNAAANVTTAVLGGPEALTEALHRRAPAWRGLSVRRYMLARRDVTGDNEATAAALAAVLQGIVSERIPGIPAPLYAAMRDILAVPEAPDGWAHFFKSGSLDSDPPVRILSGWWESDGVAVVYVVIATVAAAPDPGTGDRLAELVERIRGELARASDIH